MTDRPAGEGATPEEAQAFARAFLGFLSWVHEDNGAGRQNPVVEFAYDDD